MHVVANSLFDFHAPQALAGGILFLPCLSVCLSVCLFVCLSVDNFNVANNFVHIPSRHFIFGIPMYLMESFNLVPNMHRSRSGVKVKGHINVSKFIKFAENFNFFDLFPSRHFIFGMHMYLMETFNLIPNMPMSRSGVKVEWGA